MATDGPPFSIAGSYRKPRKTAFPEVFDDHETASADRRRGTQGGPKSPLQRPGGRR